MQQGGPTGTVFGSKEFQDEEKRTVQKLLEQKIPVEHLSTRKGAGNGSFTYVESWKAISIANSVFGFNGWSSSVVDITPDFIDQDQTGKYRVGVTAVVKVMLRDGTFHEDVGYGMCEHKNKGDAIEKAKKEAVSDARKRALRLFGNALGNSVYDREHTNLAARTPKTANPSKISFQDMRANLGEDPVTATMSDLPSMSVDGTATIGAPQSAPPTPMRQGAPAVYSAPPSRATTPLQPQQQQLPQRAPQIPSPLTHSAASSRVPSPGVPPPQQQQQQQPYRPSPPAPQHRAPPPNPAYPQQQQPQQSYQMQQQQQQAYAVKTDQSYQEAAQSDEFAMTDDDHLLLNYALDGVEGQLNAEQQEHGFAGGVIQSDENGYIYAQGPPQAGVDISPPPDKMRKLR